MSMRPRLWSLNGLATELGRDRRTMGKILGTTAPDGKLNGHSAWLLRTALNALDEHDKPQRASVAEFADGVLGHFIHRADHWQEIYSSPRIECSIEATADALGLSVETLLIWLRQGLPYVQEGSWKTGAGFTLVPCWVVDWQVKLTVLNKLVGDRDTARRLSVD